MAKITTPAMEKIAAKNAKKAGKKKKDYNFWVDAWKRFKRNKMSMVGLWILIILALVAIFAPFICPYDYAEVNIKEKMQAPSWEHIFGTDTLGRDMFSRCLYATRVSLPMGLAGCLAALVIGGAFGLVAAFFMGKTDDIVMRVMDIFQAIPGMLMALCIVAMLGTGIWQLVLALAISAMPNFAKVVRSAVLTVRGQEYIEACRTCGAGNVRLMIRHILPNCVGHIIIFVVGNVAASITMISMLSYIGLGVQPPTPEWGSLLNSGKTMIMTMPALVIFPGIFILITVFALNLFGDGVRDALDPRLK